MKRRKGDIRRRETAMFYDPDANKKPVWLTILPILMVLVIAGAVLLAYYDSLPEDGSTPLQTFIQELLEKVDSDGENGASQPE